MGCHFLLQGIFPTQILNLGLLHCRQILYCLSYQGSPLFYWGSWEGHTTRWVHLQASWLLFGNLITKVLCTSQLVLSRVSHLRNETKMARKELNTWGDFLTYCFIFSQMLKQGLTASFAWADWADSNCIDSKAIADIPWLGHRIYEDCELSSLWIRQKGFHTLECGVGACMCVWGWKMGSLTSFSSLLKFYVFLIKR